MNPQVYAKLKTLPEPERAGFLLSVGYKPSEIPDLLGSLQLAKATIKPKKTESFAEIAAKLGIHERAKELQAKAKAIVNTVEENLFERDILLNRYLMGGSTIYDEASLANPGLRNTEVIRWYREVFKTSHFKAALVIGGPGSGKTWGTLAYMNSLTTCKGNGSKVEWADSLFLTAFRLSEMFHNQKKFQDKLDELIQKKYLLIDDLGAEPSGFRGSDFIAYFDYLFSERYKFKRYTFLTSNATKEDIKAVYGERFVSRFNETGSFLETTDKDMRRE
jgi:hypothetical protein